MMLKVVWSRDGVNIDGRTPRLIRISMMMVMIMMMPIEMMITIMIMIKYDDGD